MYTHAHAFEKDLNGKYRLRWKTRCDDSDAKNSHLLTLKHLKYFSTHMWILNTVSLIKIICLCSTNKKMCERCEWHCGSNSTSILYLLLYPFSGWQRTNSTSELWFCFIFRHQLEISNISLMVVSVAKTAN